MAKNKMKRVESLFSYNVGRFCVMCKFTDKGAYKCEPSDWNLDGTLAWLQ